MTPFKALELLKDYYNRPVFNVKIGMGSAETQEVDFESAVRVYSDLLECHNRQDYQEYVYIYASDYIVDAEALDDALAVFNLGFSRGKYHG